LTHIQSNACWFLFLLFIYLRFAEAASLDKKELHCLKNGPHITFYTAEATNAILYGA
jgi:hypothetical protein